MNMHLTTDVAPRANVQAERSDGPNGPRSRSHPCARAEQRSGMGGAGTGVGAGSGAGTGSHTGNRCARPCLIWEAHHER